MVTGGFAIVCTDSSGDTCRKAAGWRIGSFVGQETAPPLESSFPELVACQVAQSAVRHILDGESVDDTPGDIVVPRGQANLEGIPIRAWLDNRSVVDVARQSLCQKSLHRNPTNVGRIRELPADVRNNNTQIEWTQGHTEDLSFVWPSEGSRRSHTPATIVGDGTEAEAKTTKPLRRDCLSGHTQHHSVTVSHLETHGRIHSCCVRVQLAGSAALSKRAPRFAESVTVLGNSCATSETTNSGPHGHREKSPQECVLWRMDRTQVHS